MRSAFGINHGEISKAKAKVGLTAAQIATRGQGQGGATKIKGALHKIGSADISLKGIGGATGRGAGNVGRFLEKRPGLTGTALVGGGGAAGYKYLSQKQPKKKS